MAWVVVVIIGIPSSRGQALFPYSQLMKTKKPSIGWAFEFIFRSSIRKYRESGSGLNKVIVA
jgi:hypothetical protein